MTCVTHSFTFKKYLFEVYPNETKLSKLLIIQAPYKILSQFLSKAKAAPLLLRRPAQVITTAAMYNSSIPCSHSRTP